MKGMKVTKPNWFGEQLQVSERVRRAQANEIKDLKELIRKNARIEDALWLDAQRDLWYAHNCLGEKVETKLGDLWRIAKSGRISPSIECVRCGAHFNAKIEMRLHYIEHDPLDDGWKTTSHSETFNQRRGNGRSNRDAEGHQSLWNRDVPVERDSEGSGGSEG